MWILFQKQVPMLSNIKKKRGKAANRVIVEYANEFHQACDLKPL
jgi:hypothetical protein